MVFPVIGGDGKPTGYEISNSVRIGSGRKLSRTFTGVSAERKKHTISCWIKLCILDGENHMLYAVAGSNNTYIRINDDHMFRFRFFDGGDDQAMFQTNKLFRDVGAWYHIVFVYDSAQGTDTNRTKLYVNGEQITSFSSGTYSGGRFPDQNEESIIGNSAVHSIEGYSSGGEFYVADWYYIGNQALSPSDFGETNDNGVWVPKKYEGSFGSTNDTFLEFKQTGTSTDASGIGADTSGEGNHMASTNLAATDITTDTPTNNFATMIPAPNLTISEGNLNFTHNRTSNWDGTTASMGVQNGKWYYEAKLTSTDASPRHNIGFAGNPETWTVVVDGKGGGADPTDNMTNAYWFHSNTNSAGYLNKTGTYGSNVSQWGIASGDIVGVALDMDNQKIYFHKNGTYYGADGNSSDPTNGTNPAYSSITTGIHYRPFLMLRNDGSETNTISMNFGNPSFSISSGNADANGYGNFEYAVPSGYYSLCTKNLAEYG